MTAEAPALHRPAGPDDDRFLRALYAEARRDELQAMPWSEEQREAFLSFQFEAQRRHYASHFPEADHVLLLQDGAPVGRLWVDRGPEEFRILDLTLHPDAEDASTVALAAAALSALVDESVARRLPVRARLDPTDSLLPAYLALGFCEAETDAPPPLYERLPLPLSPRSHV